MTSSVAKPTCTPNLSSQMPINCKMHANLKGESVTSPKIAANSPSKYFQADKSNNESKVKTIFTFAICIVLLAAKAQGEAMVELVDVVKSPHQLFDLGRRVLANILVTQSKKKLLSVDPCPSNMNARSE